MKHGCCQALASVLALAAMCQVAATEEPRPILVLDVRQVGLAEDPVCASLQGIANRQAGAPSVFLIRDWPDEAWLDHCMRITGRETRGVTLDGLLEELRAEVQGQVLYDPLKPFTLDLATTAAGLRDLVISPTDLGLPTVFDFRDRWTSVSAAYRWATATLLPQCNSSQAALLAPRSLAMRDFAIQQRMFVFSPPVTPTDDSFQTVVFQLPPGTAIFGDASAPVRSQLSRASHFVVQAAAAGNLSFLARVDAGRSFHQYVGYLETDAPRYLTLIFDCSDLNVALNEMPDLWDSPVRGNLPLGWAIPAALADAAPAVAHRYYADAYWSGTDQFVLGTSGAGHIDLALAASPYAFFDKTAKARAALDMSASLFAVGGSSPQMAEDAVRFAREAGIRGLFVMGAEDFAPAAYEEVATIFAPRFGSIEDAVTYLNRIPLGRRCAALVLDPRRLTPEDAAHLAAHVSERYVIVPPGELVEVMHELAFPQAPGAADVRVASVDFGEPSTGDAPIPVTATLVPAGEVASAAVVYRPARNPLWFVEPMRDRTSGSYSALVPPLPEGGEVFLRVRVRDRAGRVTWSPIWTVVLPRADSDSDGLSDAEEGYLLTDPDIPDTDADGLVDSADPTPLRFDQYVIRYLGPIEPPSDLPYLVDVGGSAADVQGRRIDPGEACTYWLPLPLLATGPAGVIALDVTGTVALAAGGDLSALSRVFEGDVDGIWYSGPLAREVKREGVFLRVACPETAPVGAVVGAVSVLSLPEGPSIMGLSNYPAHPGPEQPITVSATVFSPRGIDGVMLTYRVNQGGTITIPMDELEGSQRYEGRIPPLDNRDELEYWIGARDVGGTVTATTPVYLPIGGRAREVVTLVAGRDFLGDWVGADDWEGWARLAPEPGLSDVAHAYLRGGTYTFWMLAGGRGQSIDLYVRETKVGSVDPRLPDGWQRIGRARLDGGRHEVRVISREGPDAPAGVSPRYAAVILTTDSAFTPPANRVLDIYNSISLLFPPADHTLSGRIELKATGAGNITGAEFSIDGEVLRPVSGPPFRLSLNADRLTPGPHVLRVEAVDRGGRTGLAVEVPVSVAE